MQHAAYGPVIAVIFVDDEYNRFGLDVEILGDDLGDGFGKRSLFLHWTVRWRGLLYVTDGGSSSTVVASITPEAENFGLPWDERRIDASLFRRASVKAHMRASPN